MVPRCGRRRGAEASGRDARQHERSTRAVGYLRAESQSRHHRRALRRSSSDAGRRLEAEVVEVRRPATRSSPRQVVPVVLIGLRPAAEHVLLPGCPTVDLVVECSQGSGRRPTWPSWRALPPAADSATEAARQPESRRRRPAPATTHHRYRVTAVPDTDEREGARPGSLPPPLRTSFASRARRRSAGRAGPVGVAPGRPAIPTPW